MHTTDVLRSEDFKFIANGRSTCLENLFPRFHRHDRLGVIIGQTGGGIGASALILATATRFYDFYRPRLGKTPDKLSIYPETFAFHIGKRHMDHMMLDIWPPHKEVIVQDEPEQILEAINDRGITRLLVEDLPLSPAKLNRETVSSAEQRIVSTLAYSPTGRVRQADVTIHSCPAAEQEVLKSIATSEELSEEQREQLRIGRKALEAEGRVTESYRTVTLSDALQMLVRS